jgi:beta-lactamase superfamily II metal-dependent hydrolase
LILIVSHPGDDHAAGVLAALERDRHPAVLVDTVRFPREAALTQRFGGGDGPG